MVRKMQLLLLLCCLSLAVRAQQDRITLITGEEYTGRVVEIGLRQVQYLAEPADTVPHTLPLPQVFMISFANGTREVYPQHLEPAPGAGKKVLTARQLRQLGQLDAARYHNGRTAFWATFGTSILNPFFGLPLGIGMAVSAPHMYAGNVSDVNLLQEPEYVRGYQQEARRTRRAKAAAGFGAAALTYMTVILVAANGR